MFGLGVLKRTLPYQKQLHVVFRVERESGASNCYLCPEKLSRGAASTTGGVRENERVQRLQKSDSGVGVEWKSLLLNGLPSYRSNEGCEDLMQL